MIRQRHTARVSCAQRHQEAFCPAEVGLCAGRESVRLPVVVGARRGVGTCGARIGWRLGCALAVLLAWGGWAFAADVVTVLNPTHDTYFGTRPSKPRGNSARLVVSRRYTTLINFDLSEIPTS